MKGSSRWLVFTAMSFLVTGTALAAKKVEAAPAAAPQAKSWIDFSEKKDEASAGNVTRLEPMTKEEEEALKKFIRSLETTISTVQGAKLAADTKNLTEQSSQVRFLQSVNSIRAIPSPTDFQMLRDIQSIQSLRQHQTEIFGPPPALVKTADKTS